MFKELCSLYGSHKLRMTAYHPNYKTPCKQANQTLLAGLRTLAEMWQRDWPSYLLQVTYMYNNMVRTSM